jgi:hypothetical protein
MKNYKAVILYNTIQSTSNKSNVHTIWIKNIHTNVTDMTYHFGIRHSLKPIYFINNIYNGILT